MAIIGRYDFADGFKVNQKKEILNQRHRYWVAQAIRNPEGTLETLIALGMIPMAN